MKKFVQIITMGDRNKSESNEKETISLCPKW